ncbi:MAG: LptF/LptG family permease, partial [Deferribacteres bacterium]|nr:LptF/LptG family permease [Deferribacteres bacterium]
KKKTKRTKPTRMWIKHGSHICYIGVFDDKNLTAKDIKCVKINEQVDEILQAKVLKWENNRWMGYDVRIWRIEREKPENLHPERMRMDFFINPFDLKERKKQVEEMTTPELYGFIKDLKREAIDASPYLTEMYSRIFLSISPVIMVILGFPLGISRERGSGAIMGIIKGLAISAAFWMSYYSFSYLGKMGWIPPIIATSLPLIIFLAVGKKFLEEVES